MVSKRKRRRTTLTTKKQTAVSFPLMQFTLLEVKMLKDAVTIFEKTLERQQQTLPKTKFARKVVWELKQKIDDLLQQEDRSKQVPLDYNETCLLVGALHMYLLELKVAANDALIPHCIRLCAQFVALANYADKVKQQH
jgi:hypothetical protein